MSLRRLCKCKFLRVERQLPSDEPTSHLKFLAPASERHKNACKGRIVVNTCRGLRDEFLVWARPLSNLHEQIVHRSKLAKRRHLVYSMCLATHGRPFRVCEHRPTVCPFLAKITATGDHRKDLRWSPVLDRHNPKPFTMRVSSRRNVPPAAVSDGLILWHYP